jgi:hypothetical protein
MRSSTVNARATAQRPEPPLAGWSRPGLRALLQCLWVRSYAADHINLFLSWGGRSPTLRKLCS